MSTSTLAGLTVSDLRTKARREAEEVLGRVWVNRDIPVDPVAVARDLGLQVFSAQLGDDTWGMLVGSTNGVDIYLDRDQPVNRFRFSCAHEIGHFIARGAQIDPDEAFMDKRSDAGAGRADEIYANEFAAALLMPEREFRAALLNGYSGYDLADLFSVSLDAAGWRRRHLGI